MTLYEKITDLSKEHRITIKEIETRAGVARSSICKWGKGVCPSICKAKAVADALGIGVDELIDGVEL